MTEPKTYLTERFHRAMAYATELHKDQTRKSTTITYISHPFGVASLVLEANGDEDQAIAALLHDIPEDCGGEPRLREISEMFGPRIEKIVRGCSDSLVEDPVEKAPWRERKEVHIDHLNDADMDTLSSSQQPIRHITPDQSQPTCRTKALHSGIASMLSAMTSFGTTNLCTRS